jgi:type IV pilus assembly protein PilO
MKIGPREQLILVIVGLLAVLAAVSALLVWPQYQKQKSLDAQVTTAEQQLQSAKSLLAQRQQIKNRTAATDAQWLRLSSLVPENPDLPSLIIEIQDVAFASGVQIQGITPAEPAESVDKSYVVIPLQVSVVGTWADTVDYLKNLNKLTRGIREAKFAASSAPADTGEPILPNYSVSTQISLEAYMIPTAAGTAPSGAPAPAPAPTPAPAPASTPAPAAQ